MCHCYSERTNAERLEQLNLVHFKTYMNDKVKQKTEHVAARGKLNGNDSFRQYRVHFEICHWM